MFSDSWWAGYRRLQFNVFAFCILFTGSMVMNECCRYLEILSDDSIAIHLNDGLEFNGLIFDVFAGFELLW